MSKRLRKTYRNPEAFTYPSKRHGKNITVPKDRLSDGATWAFDIRGPHHGTSRGWWTHDELVENGKWDDGTACSNFQASQVLFDILRDEGRWFRCRSWFMATWWGRNIKAWWRNLWAPKEPPGPQFSLINP